MGEGPVEDHIAHAAGFATVLSAVAGDETGPILDLGSGGGLPGLVLAFHFPEREIVLLDGSVRRTEWLRLAVAACGLADQVDVVTGRAEVVAHDPLHRARYAAVVARSFGSPSVTAECGSAFLRVGGALVVSEPPEPALDRWPAEALEVIGLRPASTHAVAGGHFQVLHAEHRCPDRYPRRTGVPGKRPLYHVHGRSS